MTCVSDKSGSASSGVLTTAYTPASTTNRVAIRIKTGLRADHSIVLVSMMMLHCRLRFLRGRLRFRPGWLLGLLGCRGRCSAMLMGRIAQGRFQVAFGI